jgi:GNAT superfamily N-acetyltransferase
MSRFAIRDAVSADAEGIAIAHTESWRTSYRGILPESVLDRIDVGQRVETRRRILVDGGIHLVAYDVTHGDIVGFADAGPSRRAGRHAGELYAIYLIHRAKRYGLGTELFERVVGGLSAAGLHSLIIWVLENNHHARRFYEAMGGDLGPTFTSSVGGVPVLERAYLWDRI